VFLKRLRPTLPSPAMAVALLALFVSLGGVSWGVASGKIGTKQIRNNSVRSVDLRNNDVRGKDVRNNTLTGRDINEASLGTVPRAALADVAFSPVAYARVSAGGQVIASSSRGVTSSNITVESTSAYCFRNLPFQFKTAQATIDFQSSASQQPSLGARAVASVALGNPFSDCSGSGVQLEVVTARADTATYVRSGFFVVFWN
jgi:hypothetical protein